MEFCESNGLVCYHHIPIGKAFETLEVCQLPYPPGLCLFPQLCSTISPSPTYCTLNLPNILTHYRFPSFRVSAPWGQGFSQTPVYWHTVHLSSFSCVREYLKAPAVRKCCQGKDGGGLLGACAPLSLSLD